MSAVACQFCSYPADNGFSDEKGHFCSKECRVDFLERDVIKRMGDLM